MHDTPQRRSSDPPRPTDPTGPRRLSAWLPVGLWAGVIFALSSIPGTRLPPIDLPLADKLVHALLYGVLGALLRRALDPTRGREAAVGKVLLAILLATAYGISDEIHQSWTP